MRIFLPVVVLCLTAAASVVAAETAEQAPPDIQDLCLLKALESAAPETPAATLRSWCNGATEPQPPSRLQRNEESLRVRLALEESTQLNPFVMTPHRRNYLMPASYWSNPTWRHPEKDDRTLDDVEIKFQVSLKTPLLTRLPEKLRLYFAYTATSFFQIYNQEMSRPFRETVHTPELILARPVDWQFGPLDLEIISLGYIHQSNGQNLPTSRSWDRLFMQFVARTESWYWSIRPWWRLPESTSKDAANPRRDDNPDIEKYLGNFELALIRPSGNHVLEIMLRNNLRQSENRGAGQLDYTFPLTQRFKGIVQLFTGYGDSLINYDDYQNRFSLGILLTDTF